ncbi:MAG: HAMP domain-containing histidine kinase [Crocinitomix sp.]|nr:HAMP domain-containing histidine kinase [Crocinitomix sp.]
MTTSRTHIETIASLKAQITALEKKNKLLKKNLEHNKINLKKRQNSLVNQTIEEQHAKLMKYNKELEQFTYVATHDLKSPLANIQGYLDLIEIDLVNPSPDVLDSMKWLKYSVAEARNVISELTNALKARNNKEELLKPINLEDLVEGILSGMRAKILDSKIVFICDFTEINEFMYYPVALRSILQNIISNAIQYSSTVPFPEIKITTNNAVNEVLISVEDNGVGIDLETNESKVFGLFKRIQNDESGSGIGMYIVNKLLENYGGKLLLKSELGKGSIFTVVIPVEKV